MSERTIGAAFYRLFCQVGAICQDFLIGWSLDFACWVASGEAKKDLLAHRLIFHKRHLARLVEESGNLRPSDG